MGSQVHTQNIRTWNKGRLSAGCSRWQDPKGTVYRIIKDWQSCARLWIKMMRIWRRASIIPARWIRIWIRFQMGLWVKATCRLKRVVQWNPLQILAHRLNIVKNHNWIVRTSQITPSKITTNKPIPKFQLTPQPIQIISSK